MTPDLSICIVNHNTPDLTEQCVQSVYDTVDDLPVEVVVVNNTPDNQAEIAAWSQRFPGLQVIQNIKPLGFAANQNQMMQRARGRYLLPLNSDTVVQPGALRELVNFMDEHPSAGIAGPKLVHPDGTLQPSGRNFPTLLTHFLEASGLWQLLRHHRYIGRYYYLCSPHTEESEVDWLTAACLIVRAEAAKQVGYFNEVLFPVAYGEDMEWCWRMRQAGWRVLFNPRAVVTHLESQSPLTDRTVQMYRGLYTFCACYYSPAARQSIRIATILALWPRWLLASGHEARSVYATLMALPMPTVHPQEG